MNSSDCSQTPAPTCLQLMLRLRIPGRIPSWNAVLSMSHWQRAKAKKQLQKEFISALSLSENASAIRTTFRKNGFSTVSDIAERFEAMSRIKSPSKRRKGKRRKAKRSTRS